MDLAGAYGDLRVYDIVKAKWDGLPSSKDKKGKGGAGGKKGGKGSPGPGDMDGGKVSRTAVQHPSNGTY